MPLSKSVQEELAKEAKSLGDEIDKHQSLIEKAQARLDAINHLIGGRRKRDLSDEVVVLSDSDFEGKGFREVVRETLLDFPNGVRPFEMADFLRESNYNPGGETDLTTRVGNELNRLRKKGEAKKVGKNYVPTPALEKKS